MNGDSLRILKQVAKHGEVSLMTAVQMAKQRHGDHADQYPLALLLEDGYLGVTITHSPPEGAEGMREYSWATTLHMFTLPKERNGVIDYLGIKSSANLDPSQQRVFLKAKGALYLDEHTTKIWDRAWAFALGCIGGILAAVATSWLRGYLNLP